MVIDLFASFHFICFLRTSMDCFFLGKSSPEPWFYPKEWWKKGVFPESFTTNSRNTSILMIKTPPKSKMIKHMWTSPIKPCDFWGVFSIMGTGFLSQRSKPFWTQPAWPRPQVVAAHEEAAAACLKLVTSPSWECSL